MSIQLPFDPGNLSLELQEKWVALQTCLSTMQSALIAFSGGVDSALLSVAAHRTLGSHMLAVTVKSPFMLQQDQINADIVINQFRFPHRTLEHNDLSNSKITANDALRCYYCKFNRFQLLLEIAHQENYQWVLEGSNLDDLGDYRPGLRAVQELNIRSPFLETGMTKANIRSLAQALHMPNASSISGSCLATRIPFGTPIRLIDINQVAAGEAELLKMGFNTSRVRFRNEVAHIEINPIQLPLAMQFRKDIIKRFKEIGFTYILLDLEGYRTGSMNEVINR